MAKDRKKTVVDVEYGEALQALAEVVMEDRWRRNHADDPDESEWRRHIGLSERDWASLNYIAAVLQVTPEQALETVLREFVFAMSPEMSPEKG
jgi:hypothetical protein